MVTVPLPSSSAPGAARMLGSQRLIESWCAPMTMVEFVFPGIVAMMLCWPHECSKCSAETCFSAPADLMVSRTWLRSHSLDCRP
jgi:hypothetical protein